MTVLSTPAGITNLQLGAPQAAFDGTIAVTMLRSIRDPDGTLLQAKTSQNVSSSFAQWLVENNYASTDSPAMPPYGTNAFNRALRNDQIVATLFRQEATLPVGMVFGDSGAARRSSSFSVNSGGATIVSPGIGRIDFAQNVNMVPGQYFRMAGTSATPAYYGLKLCLTRIDNDECTYATGELTQRAASDASIVVQMLDIPCCQSPWTFLEAHFRDQITFVNCGDGATTLAENVRQLPINLAANPGIAFAHWHSGTNDLTQGTSAEDMLVSVEEGAALLKEVDAVLFIDTLLPRKTGTADAAMAAVTLAFNEGLVEGMRLGKWTVIDITTPMVDVATVFTVLDAKANVLVDESHVSMMGGLICYEAYVPVYERWLGMAPTVNRLMATSGGFTNLTVDPFFAVTYDFSGDTTTNCSVVWTQPANTHGLGLMLNGVVTFSAAGTLIMAGLPDFHGSLVPSTRYRMSLWLGVTATTAIIRNLTCTLNYSASVTYTPALLMTNITTAGATEYGTTGFTMKEFVVEFCTPAASISSSTPLITLTTGAAGVATINVATWLCESLGAAV